MFPPKFLGLAVVACVSVAAARQSLSNLRHDCEFTVDHSRYDLCPLFLDRGQDRVVKVYAELTPNTQLSYEISFGVPLATQSGKEAGTQVRTGGGGRLPRRFCNPKWADNIFSVLQAHGFV